MSNEIKCPHCGNHFSLSDIQNHEMEAFRKSAEEKFAKEMEERTEEMRKKAQEFAQKKADEVLEKAKKEAEEHEKRIRAEIEEANKKQLIELEELKKRDEENRKKETEFLKQQIEFENFKKNLEIEKEKIALESERKAKEKMEEEFTKQLQEKIALENEKIRIEHEKQLRAKEEQITQMQRSVEDLKRKSEQWSMQIQWEVLENALKDILSAEFPFDTINDVEKWIKGADLVQEVRNEFGQNVGKIAWESKNTKNWTEGWIEKLKEDRLRAGAGIAILVSNVLPNGIKHFGLYRDIWVTNYESVLPLASILRLQLIEMTKIQNSLKGKDEKMEVIYNYLVSPEFKAKIENIVEAFSTMKSDLDREKRAMEKMWSAREKQLTRVIDNTAKLYGDMQGLIGSRLPQVEYLELESGDNETI